MSLAPRIRRTLVCVGMAAWLCLCTPTSSRAFLTELVVGGQLLAELGGVVMASLPQVTLFATSLFTIAQSSEEVADTLKRIVQIFVPGKGSSKGTKNAASGKKPAPAPVVPGAVAPAPEAAPPLQEPAAVPEARNDVGVLVDRLVAAYASQAALGQQLKGFAEGSPERAALAEGYAELVSEHASALERLAAVVLDGIRAGDASLVTAFVTKLRSLDAAAKPAVAPALAQVMERGRKFAELQGKGEGAALFAALGEASRDLGSSPASR